MSKQILKPSVSRHTTSTFKPSTDGAKFSSCLNQVKSMLHKQRETQALTTQTLQQQTSHMQTQESTIAQANRLLDSKRQQVENRQMVVSTAAKETQTQVAAALQKAEQGVRMSCTSTTTLDDTLVKCTQAHDQLQAHVDKGSSVLTQLQEARVRGDQKLAVNLSEKAVSQQATAEAAETKSEWAQKRMAATDTISALEQETATTNMNNATTIKQEGELREELRIRSEFDQATKTEQAAVSEAAEAEHKAAADLEDEQGAHNERQEHAHNMHDDADADAEQTHAQVTAMNTQANADEVQCLLAEQQSNEQQSAAASKMAELEQAKGTLAAAKTATEARKVAKSGVFKEQGGADGCLASVKNSLSEQTQTFKTLQGDVDALTKQSTGAKKELKAVQSKVIKAATNLTKLDNTHTILSGEKAAAEQKLSSSVRHVLNNSDSSGSGSSNGTAAGGGQAQQRAEGLKKSLEAKITARNDCLAELEHQQKANELREILTSVKGQVELAQASLLSTDGLTKEQTRLNDAAKKELEDKDASEKAKASKKRGGKGGGGGNCGEDDLMKGIRVGLEQELQDIKEKNSWAEEQLENEVEKAVEYINGTGCV